MPYAPLPQRGLISLSGENVLNFLQGLVSNDVLRLAEVGIVYAALLSPQGKFLHDFFVLAGKDSVLIDCEKTRLPDLVQRLKMYRLRSQITMDALPDTFSVTALWSIPDILEAGEDIRVLRDPRLAELGWRAVGDTATVDAWCRRQKIMPADEDAYDRFRLEMGVPEGGRDMIFEKSFLLPFGFEDLHGVDFKKGCYVGQEVTARSKHLGQIRKFIYQVSSPGNALPPPGTAICRGEKNVGELRSAHGNIGLALMSVEEMEKNEQNERFRCGDSLLEVRLPSWVKTPPSSGA